MSEAELPHDHFVSRGYQQNFASADKRVAVFDAATGQMIDPRRPIKSNFREQGFTTFRDAGVPKDLLERAFASVEKRVLNEVRTIDVRRQGPQQRADVANLFAIHLVRSPAFKAFHRHVGSNFRSSSVPEFARRRDLVALFEKSNGRPPEPGELDEIAKAAYDDLVADPMQLVTTMLEKHDQIAEILNGFHLQLIVIADKRLPGFVIGDTPVVHARPGDSLYGFRDRLALLDADLIIGPLTSRIAVALGKRPMRTERLTTRKMVDRINAVFCRAAYQQVACHPADAKAVAQTLRNLERLKPELLTGR